MIFKWKKKKFSCTHKQNLSFTKLNQQDMDLLYIMQIVKVEFQLFLNYFVEFFLKIKY